MDILFCDNHLLIVEKPLGISTQPDLVDLAKTWIKNCFHKPGKVFLEPVHRLDKPVGGIVLLARTSKALARLQKQMREQKVARSYVAVVEGRLPTCRGVLRHYIVHDAFRARVMVFGDVEAKEAILSYEELSFDGEQSLLKVDLQTGRYHQIRVQMSAMGCPIVGDRLYGSREMWKGEGKIALYHREMGFYHPISREWRCFLSKRAAAIKPNMLIPAAKALIVKKASVKAW